MNLAKVAGCCEKFKAYFREPSPEKFEFMQKCFFCGIKMENPAKSHHNWQLKWPLLWASFSTFAVASVFAVTCFSCFPHGTFYDLVNILS